MSDIVTTGFYGELTAQSQIFAPIRSGVRFGKSVTTLYGFDADGHLVPQVLVGVTTIPGPLPGCGWGVVPNQETYAFLPLKIPFLPLTVQIAYLAGADTTMTVQLGTTTTIVPLSKGPHDVYFPMAAGGAVMVLSGTGPGVAVCVDHVTMGQRVSAPRQP